MSTSSITTNPTETYELRSLLDRLLDIDDINLFNEILNLEHKREDGEIGHDQYLEDVQKMNAKVSEIEIQAAPRELLAKANAISKEYSSFRLGPLNIDVYSKEVIGLVGENGNGKTTLLRMLASDLSVTGGDIEYPFVEDSKDVYNLRTQLIYIPQRTPTWHGYVKDNLVFCALLYDIPKERVDTMVEIWMLRFGIWRFRNFKWSELSSGYKMRFELVRSFLRNPKLMLIDEPLANLDVMAQHLILEDLQMLVKLKRYPKGIVLSSQQLYEVERNSDKVIFLKDGQQLDTDFIQAEDDLDGCLIELDSTAEVSQIETALSHLQKVNIEYSSNGLIINVLEPGITPNKILQILIMADVDIRYFRDISKSTRRLFTNSI